MCGAPVLVTASECSACGELLKHHFQLKEEEIRAELIRKYRREMLALIGFFLIVGTIAGGVGGMMLQESLPIRPGFVINDLSLAATGVFVLSCGLGWIVCGIASVQKKMSGVRAGRIICYLVVGLNLILVFVQPLFICGALLLIPVIKQCHRVQTISRQMGAAGVPLSYKPK